MLSFIDSLSKTKKNILLGGFLIGALVLTVIVAQKQTSYKQRASEIVSPPTTTGNITLEAQSTKTTLIPGEQTDLDVYLLAGDQNVTGLSFSLAPVGNVGIGLSSPAIVSMHSVVLPTPPVFNNTLRNSAAFSFHYAGVDTVGNVASGKVKIASLKIAALQRGKTELLFQNVQATALGQIGLLNNQQNVNIQFTIDSGTTPTVVPPTATPTPGIIGSCKILYDKIITAYDNANACGGKYDAAADLNKDKFVNNQDYLLFLQNTNSGTNQVACTNYLNNTTNPCVIPTPTGNVGIGKTIPTITITIAPPTSTPSGPVPGDATGDRIVDIRDYNRWKDEYLEALTTKTADFNKDGKIDLIDFSIFRKAFNP